MPVLSISSGVLKREALGISEQAELAQYQKLCSLNAKYKRCEFDVIDGKNMTIENTVSKSNL